MRERFAGFDWDTGNRAKCEKHGVSVAEIEALFFGSLLMMPDTAHSQTEVRTWALGKATDGRMIFLVFTVRRNSGRRLIRPISARYMHAKEIVHYEKENPGL